MPGEWALYATTGEAEWSSIGRAGAPDGSAEQVPREGRNHLGELSERELDVLALAAEGLSNDEIAARLYLSVRTVERHLSNIYAKLRVSGKAARAAAAARFSASR